jgi:hypothetical protein
MNSSDQLQHEVDAVLGLYRDVMDSIIRTEQRLNRSRALLELTVARMVAHTGSVEAVAELIGQTPEYVAEVVRRSSTDTVT